MFMNYGGCALYMKEGLPPLVIDDYIYVNNNGVVTLIKYIGTNQNPVVPTPPSA